MAEKIKRTPLGAATKTNAEIIGETTGTDMTPPEPAPVPDPPDGPYSSDSQRLKVINDAIYAILVGGQSYKIGSRTLTRADLNTLLSERDRLEANLTADECSVLFPGTFAADFGFDNRR